MVKHSLVIGGAGFVGFHLASSLAKQGQKVTILDNFARGKSDAHFKALILRSNIQFMQGDVTKPETFSKLQDSQYDFVYFLAAINGTKNFYERPHLVLQVGIKGMFNALDWFVKQKKGKFLFTSSSETYAGALNIMGDKFPIPTHENVPLVVEDPSNPRWSYGVSKLASEVIIYSYAKAYNLKNFCIVRYHNVYGPRMGYDHVIPEFIERILKNEKPFKIYGGKESRTFCYVDDAVWATQKIMESPKTNGHIVHIGRSDGELSIVDLAKALFEVTGYDADIKILSAPKGSVLRRCPDITKLKALGFKPRVDLNDGLRRCVEWYIQNPIEEIGRNN